MNRQLKRILHVEDVPSIQVVTRIALEKIGGFEVLSCPSGQAALDQVQAFAPDLILLETVLPKMDGFELCRRLRQDPRHAGRKILFLTARGRDIDRAKGLALGADGYLTKPFSTRELLEHMERLLAPGAA